jgi:hypothetical protein
MALQKLNDQFRHVAPKLDIVSFYETQPTPIVRKLEKGAAVVSPIRAALLSNVCLMGAR